MLAHMVKNLTEMKDTWVWSLGWEDPWRQEWQPTPILLLGQSHGHRNLGAPVCGLTQSRTQVNTSNQEGVSNFKMQT